MVGSYGACTFIPSFLDGLACVPQQWSELKRENITLCLQEMRKLRIQQLAGLDQAHRVTAGPSPAKAAQVCRGTDTDGVGERVVRGCQV